MAQQLGDPFGVFDIGFAARDRFDMLRIDEQQLEEPFEQIVDGANTGRYFPSPRGYNPPLTANPPTSIGRGSSCERFASL
jgi:hypothetical protein